MPPQVKEPVVAVVGPTASGKSELAQLLAQQLDGEVVSADSMQIYRGMDIGTGKLPRSEQVVKHYGLDLVDPGEPYSAALFQDYARRCFYHIGGKGKVPILCGGTGFYVRAAIDDYDFPRGEQIGNAVRDEMNALAASEGAHALWKRLEAVDPRSAAIIPEGDVKRVVRAFELLEEGTTYADQKQRLSRIAQFWPCTFIGLQVDPEILRARIRDRVDNMVAGGLVDEVCGLLDKGLRDGITAPQAIGYKEIVSALDGEITLEEAIEQIKVSTCRYAKRQRTWFRKDSRIHWIDANQADFDRMLNESIDLIRAGNST